MVLDKAVLSPLHIELRLWVVKEKSVLSTRDSSLTMVFRLL